MHVQGITKYMSGLGRSMAMLVSLYYSRHVCPLIIYAFTSVGLHYW